MQIYEMKQYTLYYLPGDQSQNWAAAAALWAQQRQMQEQYHNSNETAPLPPERPPEPAPPPPQLPPLPPTEDDNVEVHDYNHGKPTQIIDYQHQNASSVPSHPGPPPVPPSADVIDYNHGKNNDTSANIAAAPVPGFHQGNWDYNNDSWQQHQPAEQFHYQQHQQQQHWDPNYNQEWQPANYYNGKNSQFDSHNHTENQNASGFQLSKGRLHGENDNSGNSTPGEIFYE